MNQPTDAYHGNPPRRGRGSFLFEIAKIRKRCATAEEIGVLKTLATRMIDDGNFLMSIAHLLENPEASQLHELAKERIRTIAMFLTHV
jgi:hypothetical protein